MHLKTPPPYAVGTSVFHPSKSGFVALCTFGCSREGAKNCGTVDSPTEKKMHPASTAATVKSGDLSRNHAANSTPKSTRSVPDEDASTRTVALLEFISVLALQNTRCGMQWRGVIMLALTTAPNGTRRKAPGGLRSHNDSDDSLPLPSSSIVRVCVYIYIYIFYFFYPAKAE